MTSIMAFPFESLWKSFYLLRPQKQRIRYLKIMTWAKPRTSGVWMPKLPGAPVQCWQTSHCPTPPCERACRRPEMSGLHTEIYTAYQPNPTKKDRIKPFEDVWPTIVMHNWQGQVRGDFNHDWDFHLVMTSVTLPVIALCLLVWNPGIWCWNLHFHLQFWTPTRRLHKFVVNLLLRSKWQVFTGENVTNRGGFNQPWKGKKSHTGQQRLQLEHEPMLGRYQECRDLSP